MGPTIAAAATHGVAYRVETEADVPFVRDLYAAVRAPELAPILWSAEQKRAFLDDQFDKQRHWYRTQYQADWLIVERAGQPIGRLYLLRAADRHEVIDISLVDGVRGQGLGGAILRDVLADADAAAVPVQVYVESFNPAKRLYDRLGFVPVETGGVYDRMIRMPPAILS